MSPLLLALVAGLFAGCAATRPISDVALGAGGARPRGTPNPLNILHDPAALEWQPIVKIEHYRLRQDSIKHPVGLKEEAPLYKTRGDQ